MQSKIDNLVKMYKNNKGKYLFDNVENLEFDENGNINISLAFANGRYYIFVFLLKKTLFRKNKLIYKGLYMNSDKNLMKEYEQLKEKMNALSFDEFIDKYYDLLINNENKLV